MICNMSKNKQNSKQNKDTFKHSLVIENNVECDNKTGTFWGKETKFLKKIMLTYPDKSFWMSVRFRPKLKTLLQLYNEPFMSELKRRYNLKNLSFDLPKDEEVKRSKRKSGKKPVLNKKPKTLRQFLSNGASKKTKSTRRGIK